MFTLRRRSFSVLNLNVKNKVATLELNNPPVNVFTRELLQEFPKALTQAEEEGADVVVVKKGYRVFVLDDLCTFV